MSRFSMLLVSAFTLVSVSYAGGTETMIQQADLVVVGSTTSITNTWPTVSLAITIEQVLKGSEKVGSTISAHTASPYAQNYPAVQIEEKHRGIWFLQADKERGGYSAIVADGGSIAPLNNVYYPAPALPVSASVLTPNTGDSVAEAVVKLVAAAVEEGTGRPILVSHAAAGVKSQKVDSILNYLSQSQRPEVSLVGLASRVQNGDNAALLQFLKIWKTLSPADADIVAGCIPTTTDTETIRALGAAVLDPSATQILRQRGSLALRRSHSREALPFLAALLDSPDLLVQLQAVNGLSAIANGFDTENDKSTVSMSWLMNRMPTALTTADTSKYMLMLGDMDTSTRSEMVNFWKTWWKDHHNALGF